MDHVIKSAAREFWDYGRLPYFSNRAWALIFGWVVCFLIGLCSTLYSVATIPPK